MLRYSEAQIEALVANRRAFNACETAMAQQFGLQNAVSTALIGNASPLPRDVWGDWDRESVGLQRSILAVFSDLAGSVSQPMPIGKLVQYFRTVSDSGVANISLDGQSEAKTDQPVYAYHGTPLPIIDSTFSYGWRQVAAAQTEGESLDSDGRENAVRRVAEKLETIALDGDSDIVVAGAPLYGLRNHPKRNTRTTGVTLNGATGPQIVAEFTALLKLLHTDNFKNISATIYMNFDDWFYMSNTDFSTQYPNKSILQRVMEIAGIGSIVPADRIVANELIAVVKDTRVVRVLSGMPLSTIALFRQNPMDPYNFKTMAAAALQIKFDADDNCGIAHSASA
ncbi:MAG: major capsid protein [Pseudomonadota bacterium]